MPKLNPQRVAFLNKELKQQITLEASSLYGSYLEIKQILNSKDIQYKLVRKSLTTNEEFPGFRANNPNRTYHSIYIKLERFHLLGLNDIGKQRLHKIHLKSIQEKLKSASLELHCQEQGFHRNLSLKMDAFLRISFVGILFGSLALITAIGPFAFIPFFISLIGAMVGPQIINFFMQKRFDKKLAKNPVDTELKKEIDQLIDQYYKEYGVSPEQSVTNESVVIIENRPTLLYEEEPLTTLQTNHDTIAASQQDTMRDKPW